MRIESLERRALLAITVDPTFPNPEALPIDNPGAEISVPGFLQVLSNGKIVTGGVLSPSDLTRFRVARFNADGTPDTSFGGARADGISDTLSIGTGITSSSINISDGAIQSDGKIVLAAGTLTGFAVARYNADGTIDTTFGGDGSPANDVDGIPGIEIIDAGIAQAGAGDEIDDPSVAIAPDGHIYVVGDWTSDGVEGAGLFVTRLNSDGSVDTAFGGTSARAPGVVDVGQNIDPSETKIFAHDIAITSGGNKPIVLAELGVAGNNNRKPALIQLTTAGAPDTAFNTIGSKAFEFISDANGDEAGKMIVQGDGKIVVVGSTTTGTNTTAITRFNADGALDTSFGTGGVGLAGPPLQREPYTFTMDHNGHFVVSIDTSISRFTAGGDPDITFADNATQPVPGVGQALLLSFDATDNAYVVDGGAIKRLFLTDEQRPDVALGNNGVLIITGNTGTADNTITISRTGPDLIVNRNGVNHTFAGDMVTQLDILTFDGDDRVTVTANVDAKIVTGDGANTVTVADGGGVITTGDGNDTIDGGDSTYLVNAGGGNDTVTLGNGVAVNGSDTRAGNIVHGGDGNDRVTTGDGADKISGDAGNDSISSGGGNDIVFGGVQLETEGQGYPEFLDAPDGNNTLDGGDGNDILVGGGGRDTIQGGAGKDEIVGYGGADLLSGGGGKDKIAGMRGRDHLYGGNGDDQLDAGNSPDPSSNNLLVGGAGNDRLVASGDGGDTLMGNEGDDRSYTKNNAIDHVDGGAGDNTAVNFDDIDEILNATKVPPPV